MALKILNYFNAKITLMNYFFSFEHGLHCASQTLTLPTLTLAVLSKYCASRVPSLALAVTINHFLQRTPIYKEN